VEGVFRLADQRVGWAATPRTEIEWLDISDTQEQLRAAIMESTHSRFPVCRDSLDEVLGIVEVKDLLDSILAGQPLELQNLTREPIFVPESMSVLQVLEEFRQESEHIALVVDEYGVVQGLVTVTDVLEAIVGDIPADETDVPLAVQREDGSWLVDGLLPVDDFKDLFEVEALPGEGNYQTLGGFVVDQLGRIPDAGDHFQWDKLRVEVMDMDGNRVDKVLVSAPPPAPSANGGAAED
jgi:putative hemolysin